ncbi:NifU-like protein 4, mitochondrial [Tilletia horrida]|uniref:NifU-like protein 4, mitochondrial n=1 Tax=Tilletia horrida TaxID=155126 RepID=A0AAN6JQ94_9BASI|nr:NifU-like protein 4, mitochondrial [Tilletia horrida]KAK0564179.1 NifU-like protein 4, mitochondrial [Tilletia horrida]
MIVQTTLRTAANAARRTALKSVGRPAGTTGAAAESCLAAAFSTATIAQSSSILAVSRAIASAPSSSSSSHHQQHRPQPNNVSLGASIASGSGSRRTMFIQTETTPNEDSLKFLPGQRVMEAGTAEFLDNRSSMSSPLAKRLFNVSGVRSVFYGPDFITVSKHSDIPWSTLKPEVFATLMEFFSSGLALFPEGDGAAEHVAQDTVILDTDSETVAMIKELLDTRVRPAIQEDGGDIEYRGFTDPEEGGDGIVRLMLKGSCRGCDSSTVTLKSGIERMLMHYIPEVKGVEQVLDVEDEMAQSEFAKFEKKLEKDRQRERERGFSV